MVAPGPSGDGEAGRVQAAPAWLASVGALLVIAGQVAAKATRDAFFLASLDVRHLPVAMAVGAATAIIAVLAANDLVARRGPGFVAPRALALSGVAYVGESWLAGHAPAVAAVALYLHVAASGGILVSIFWAIVGELFDPRAAKRAVGRIAAAASAGGVAGGALAERMGTTLGPASTLLALAATSAVGAVVAAALAKHAPGAEPDGRSASPFHALGRTPYLRDLGALVALTSISAALLDYVLKAEAAAAHQTPEGLVRFFAVFHGAVSVFAFAVQLSASRPALEKLGLTLVAASLPVTLVLGVPVVLALPTLANVAALRGVESVLRSSLFRTAYELFFNPIPTREKRAAKTVVDVGFDRVGDAIGAVVARGALAVAGELAHTVLLVLAGVAAALAAVATRRLEAGYVSALERSLLERSVDLDERLRFDKTTRALYLSLAGTLASPPGAPGTLTARVEELTSSDDQRAIAALAAPLTPEVVPHVVRLLARPDVDRHAATALRRAVRAMTPDVVAGLGDPGLPVSTRVRLARIAREGEPSAAARGLLLGLNAADDAVRAACGRSLARLVDAGAVDGLDAERVFDAVGREVERLVLDGRGVRVGLGPVAPSDADAEDDTAPPVAGVEHVFVLLSLVLPRDPLRAAYAGLAGGDPRARATAVEYLESVLPPGVSRRLVPLLER